MASRKRISPADGELLLMLVQRYGAEALSAHIAKLAKPPKKVGRPLGGVLLALEVDWATKQFQKNGSRGPQSRAIEAVADEHGIEPQSLRRNYFRQKAHLKGRTRLVTKI